MGETKSHREGDLYKTLTVGGKEFIVVYGYYSENERLTCDPMPIYPNLSEYPEFTDDGKPIVTCIQDACTHYRPLNGQSGEGWCADCSYYSDPKEEIGVCQNNNMNAIHNHPLEEA